MYGASHGKGRSQRASEDHGDTVTGRSLLDAIVKRDPLQPFSVLASWGQNSYSMDSYWPSWGHLLMLNKSKQT